ncbi:hypothetical protein V5O48_012343 [Marasmius crinis-equi]|uniref:Carboxylic ester hydrolase n=1 Tax=Marasmius crinis-equi TaxID=585013 RepID=A0ABR3F3H6_9AGAR
MHLSRSAQSLFTALQLSPSFDFNTSCSLAQLSIPFSNSTSTHLLNASIVPAGTQITFPDVDSSCETSSDPQVLSDDICRVILQVDTSSTSSIHMEAWLPRHWTGRFLSTGNGGLGGCIKYQDVANGASLGFATVGANNGHDGNTGAPFENRPEVLKDFVFRSIHTNVVVGKQITEHFYEQPHTKSYYFGCSTGGRQGLKSVEDFPEDFDGVIAGAPAANFVGLLSWTGHFFTEITGPSSSPAFIPVDVWLGLIHDDVLSQCDEIDGVQDGIIEDPNLCDYDPSGLLCTDSDATNNTTCLTPTQIETVRKVYTPFLDIFPRAQPGGETAGGLAKSIAGEFFAYTSDWFKYVVYPMENRSEPLDPNAITVDDYRRAIEADPFGISTWKGEHGRFRERGGKLLTYHGQADGLITPRISEEYYDHVKRVSGELDEYFRFFRISGMEHCSQGAGAWNIGQVRLGVPRSEWMEPERNVLAAIVRWVEEGIAPETIEGVKFVKDDPEQGEAFRRRHCRYPLRATYGGEGNSTRPESWSCQDV